MPLSDSQLHYPIAQRTLGNGLRVVVSPDHSVPVVAVNLWYDVGSRDERPGEFGWAHLFEHLMFSGSAHVGSGEHLNRLQALGGSVNATTWFDRTNYYDTIPVGALDLALWMEADRLATLADHLNQAAVDTQREVVKEEKRQRYDNVPYGDAMEALVGLTFGVEHPYGHTTIGSMADLEAASPSAAADFFRRHYRPDNAVLTLVGDISAKDGFKKAERYFGQVPGWNRRNRPASVGAVPLTGLPTRVLTGQVPAATTYFGWRLPPRDTAAFDACELSLAILGSGQTSRLHRTLVRDLQVAAGVAASALPLIGGNSLGIVHLSAHSGQSIEPAREAALAELDQLAEHGPTQAELDRARMQWEREWLTDLASLATRADLLSGYTTLHGDPESVNRRLDEIRRVSVADAAAACVEFLRADQRAQLDYLPEVH